MPPVVPDDPLARVSRPETDTGLPAMPYPDFMPKARSGILRPYSAWPRCTRWASIRQTVARNRRVHGRWLFRSDWLRQHIVVGAVEGLAVNPWDATLDRWLDERDNADERVTRLPDDWHAALFPVGVYFDSGHCRAFCVACNRVIPQAEPIEARNGARRGDLGVRVCCPWQHVPLDLVLLHVD